MILKKTSLNKINTKFIFEKEIFVDRFLYQNWEKFKQFREKIDSMTWNKAKLESNLSNYEIKGIKLDEFFTYTKKILLEQMNNSVALKDEEMIPDESDMYEVITPDSIGLMGYQTKDINKTIGLLSDFEEILRENLDKQNYFIMNLK